jgi:hypothetical protein
MALGHDNIRETALARLGRVGQPRAAGAIRYTSSGTPTMYGEDWSGDSDSYWNCLRPSFFTRAFRVVGRMPSNSAAPPAP